MAAEFNKQEISCEVDADCEESHICVKHMWKNLLEGEYNSGSGCAWNTVCRGDMTWIYYGCTQWIQYFCSAEQIEKANATDAADPFPGIWTRTTKKHQGDWE